MKEESQVWPASCPAAAWSLPAIRPPPATSCCPQADALLHFLPLERPTTLDHRTKRIAGEGGAGLKKERPPGLLGLLDGAVRPRLSVARRLVGLLAQSGPCHSIPKEAWLAYLP